MSGFTYIVYSLDYYNMLTTVSTCGARATSSVTRAVKIGLELPRLSGRRRPPTGGRRSTNEAVRDGIHAPMAVAGKACAVVSAGLKRRPVASQVCVDV